MRTIFTIIFFVNLAFDFFMITPFGVYWAIQNHCDNKPCYGFIIVFVTVVPMMFIGLSLGYIE